MQSTGIVKAWHPLEPVARPGSISKASLTARQVWFEEKGFGFVSPEGGGDDCYVHRTALPPLKGSYPQLS